MILFIYFLSVSRLGINVKQSGFDVRIRGSERKDDETTAGGREDERHGERKRERLLLMII